MRSIGPYFTWTNRTIWTRIDRALVNTLWYDQFDFSQVIYLANSLSDHTALIIDTPNCPKPLFTFQFCDKWTRDSSFPPLVTSQLTTSSHQGANHALKVFLRKTKVKLERAQLLLQTNPVNTQLMQREREMREHYIKLLTSVIDIIRQQCKTEWITYGDDCTRTTIRGYWESKTPREDKLTPRQIIRSPKLFLEGFQEGSLPMRYLGVPVTASRLSKLECRGLVKKIMGKIRFWATKSISFVGRAQLLNLVVFGMISYWASIFILPQDVIDQLNQIYRNYLLGGDGRIPKKPLHLMD
ncbi:hypothetical protein Cgig2_030549 [Carnegiea gigantea]|uniref:Reverse transcriptase n=1 Tax=Carnegiea gigantea TaxID=171969 RepID=A0A9Q1JI55_9CARY|nr:hypothetical protein Cgig2_030549 [Carnegiea gigantea]